jgi:hypothetical protein
MALFIQEPKEPPDLAIISGCDPTLSNGSGFLSIFLAQLRQQRATRDSFIGE